MPMNQLALAMANDVSEGIDLRNRDQFSVEWISQIAKYQRWIRLLILLGLFCLGMEECFSQIIHRNFSPDTIRFITLGNALCIMVIVVLYTIFVYRLAKLLNIKSPRLSALLCLVPLFGTLELVFVNRLATLLLRRNGLHVGLLGVAPRNLNKL